MKDLIKRILREEKKKLFIPRKIDEREVEFEKMVKDTNDRFLKDNDIKTLNYSIKTQNRSGELSYLDIVDATFNGGEIILNNGEDMKLYYNGNKWSIASDFNEYSLIISEYLNSLIKENYPNESKIIGLDISVESVVGKIKIDGIIVFVSYDRYLSRNIDRINFSKTI
jgi:hypothetical protein